MNIWYLIIAGFFLFTFSSAYSQNFSVKKSADGVEISENNKPVLFYQFKTKTVDGKYPRAGYIHPLYDLDGNVVTEDMPEDHPYHRGIFWAWHQIVLNNKNVADGWMSENISFDPGKMQVTKGNKNAILSAQLVWRIKDSTKGTVNLINETSKIKVLAAKGDYRIIDFDILLKPLLDNIMLGGSDDPKGYGGFCLRIKLPEDIRFVSNNGPVEPKETAVNAGPWMDFVTNTHGITVFGYKSDSKDEQYPWILRSSKSMQNVPYPGRNPVAVPKEGLHLKYRVIVHKKDFSPEKIRELYKEYQPQ